MPGVHVVHAGASIPTLTIDRSLEVQLPLFVQTKRDGPTDCANAVAEKSKVKNKKAVVIGNRLINLLRDRNKLFMIV